MSNPFDEEAPGASSGSKNRNFKPVTKRAQPQKADDDWSHYENQIENAMQQTLESTKRSVMMLEESEQAGIKTAIELDEQGEKLRNVDKKLDDINVATVQTQRNLNNIKSVFGGFKNYFSKKAPIPSTDSSMTSGPGNMKKSATVGGTDCDRLKNKVEQIQSSQSAVKPGGHTLTEDSRKAIAGTRWETMDNEIDENLDAMSANLARLKNLGAALGDEVDKQNDLLENINRKTDKTDIVIRNQDQQMKKILNIKDEPVQIKKGSTETGSSSTASAPQPDGGWTKQKKGWF